ncbi:MAG: glycosyltransferase [Tannerellaceae bacterium]|jgi:hypothetical protein|nr:glycosyltransferase [Tannerellaceae bacterium]
MRNIHSFILYNDREDAETEQALRQSNLVKRITRLQAGKYPASSLIRDIAAQAEADYILLIHEPVEPGLFALERMISVAEDTSAGMLYADYREETGREHPLIDYRKGSLRDDFDFGLVQMYHTGAFREASADMTDDYRFAGLYDLRLSLSRKSPIVHVSEYLYRKKESEERSQASEAQFDYLSPQNREVQIEMERACTGHLRRIGGFLPSVETVIDAQEPSFPFEASIIIPVRNRARTIREAVESVLSQETKFSFNIIAVDNYSTDGTTALLSYIAEKDDRLIHLIPERRDLGIGGCWNYAVSHPRCGRFSIQLDSDDVFRTTGAVQNIVDAFYHYRCAMVIGTYQLTDFNKRSIPPGVIDHSEWTAENGHNNALRINGLGAPRAFFTPLLRSLKLPDTSYGEDYAAGLRISREYKIGRIYDVLYLCRRWEDNSDAHPSLDKINERNAYKDSLRTWELEARIKMNRSGR